MWVDGGETRLLADGAYPAVSGSPIESLPILSLEDRTLGAFADGQVNRPSSSVHQRDYRRFTPLAHDPERSMPLMEGQILDVGSAGFAHPEPIEPEQHGQSRVALVAALGREQEGVLPRRSRPRPSEG